MAEIPEQVRKQAVAIARRCAKTWTAVARIWDWQPETPFERFLRDLYPSEYQQASLAGFLWRRLGEHVFDGILRCPFDPLALEQAFLEEIAKYLRTCMQPSLLLWMKEEFESLLRQALQTLTQQEAKVLELRYGFFGNELHTFPAIGEALSISRSSANQAHKRALRKLLDSWYVDFRRFCNWGSAIAHHQHLCEEHRKVEGLFEWYAAREGKTITQVREEFDAELSYRCQKEAERQWEERLRWHKETPLGRLCTPVEYLELSVRSANVFRNNNIQYMIELVKMREHELLKLRNFGQKCLGEVREILAERGLQLGMEVPDLPRAMIVRILAGEAALQEETERIVTEFYKTDL